MEEAHAKEQIEQEKKICDVTQTGSQRFLFCLHAPAPVVSNPSSPNYVASQSKPIAKRDFMPILLLMLCHSIVLPFASAQENKQVLSLAMGETLNSSLRNWGGTMEIHI